MFQEKNNFTSKVIIYLLKYKLKLYYTQFIFKFY